MSSDQQPMAPILTEQTPQSKPNRKKWSVLAIVLVVGIAGTIIGTHHHTITTRQITAAQNNNPNHLNGIAVGNNAYVNACDVFTPQQQAALFGAAGANALVQAQYAENGLPVKDISADGVDSNCSRTFADDTPYNGTTLTFDIDQFATAAAAKAQYAAYSQTQSDLDTANQRIGGNLTTDFTPLGSVANTVYSPTNTISYTLDGNKILSFTALLGEVSNDTFKQALMSAVPAMVTATASQKPAYPMLSDISFGKSIGNATIKNPCSFFTANDFANAYGGASDPSAITIMYTHRANEYPPDDTSRGWANNSCERNRYPGTTTAVSDMKVELRYYKSASEANQELTDYVQQETTGSSSDATAQTVTGIGNYAVLLNKTDSNLPNDFYIQKGAYVLVLNGQATNGNSDLSNPSSMQYQRLAKILTAKL